MRRGGSSLRAKCQKNFFQKNALGPLTSSYFVLYCYMITTKLQHHGKDTAVVLEGDDQQEITERFYSFWNHGATSGELEWQNATRATFWARGDGEVLGRDKILKAIEGATLFKLLNDAGSVAWKKVKGGAMPTAKVIAKELYDSFEPLVGEGRCIKINSLYEPYQEPFDAQETAGFAFLQKQEHGCGDGDGGGRWGQAKSSLEK